MTSNAYIASDGEKLMKVGKANDPQRREKQIALPITCTVACLDEAAAFRVEHKLRDFVIKRGGIRHVATKDWFAFDPQIYEMLCEFVATQDGFAPIPVKVETEADIDAEIAALRKRYFKLLEDELQRELNKALAEKAELKEKIKWLDEEIYILQRATWMPIEEIEAKYGDTHPELVRTLKEQRRELQQKDDEIARIIAEKNDEIARILSGKNIGVKNNSKESVYTQTEIYLKDFMEHIAPLHEEIGALKAEIRFLQETYGP